MSVQDLKSLIFSSVRPGTYIEGSASDEELNYLANLSSDPKVKSIAEIGFNTGFSSYAFLSSNSHVQVVSFDIGEHSYVTIAKKNIDEVFPHRHQLIVGDSRDTVPQYSVDNPNITFDIIFIDGGHDFETAQSDLKNVLKLCHVGTLLVIDDLTPWKPWGVGPTRAWNNFLAEGNASQIDLQYNGKKIEIIPSDGEKRDRIWAVAHYDKSKKQS